MKKILLISIFLVLWLSNSNAQTETKLLRFPTIHDNTVVFTYAGDLYIADIADGNARKLTNDSRGFEMFAHISPDGKNVAFTAQYDGNTEVYVMPITGGEPKRLTYTATLTRDDISDRMGPNNIVMTWTPDGKSIIYRSRCKAFNDFTGRLYKVSIDGGMPQEMPLTVGSWCTFSPDGAKMAMNKVFREFRTWKYYKGGMADDVWIYDVKSGESNRISNTDNQEIFPMWYGEKIFFCSDRDRTMNIFCYNTTTKQTKKVTNFDNYDVKFPTLGNKNIIFENGGCLYTLDPTTEQVKKLTIYINDDFSMGRNKMKDASKNIRSIDIAPDGNRVVISGRGDVYSVPATTGITRNLTHSSGAHDRNATWSPDGKYIAYISDKDGEFDIYRQVQDGSKEPEKLVDGSESYIFNILWSPDGNKIAFSDRLMRLRIVDVNTKSIVDVETNPYWEIRDYSWSPDSKWLTYTHQESNEFESVMLYSLENKTTHNVTDKWYSSGNPVFSSDGKYLFFTSDRDFNPTYSSTEWNHVYNNMARMYFVILSKDTKNPLGYVNNEVKVSDDKQEAGKEDKKQNKKDDKEKVTKAVDVVIDFDGIESRVVNVPLNNTSYYAPLACVDDNLYYIKYERGSGSTLCMYKLSPQDGKEVELGKGMSMMFTPDYKKVAVVKGGRNIYVMDTPKAKLTLKDAVDLSGMKVVVDNKAEWAQIYTEAWRQMRDFFYVKNMHGVDWKKMHDKYAALLPYVNTKDDLNYLIGELIGELNVGHAYIGGGDVVRPQRIELGLLGAEVEKDESGYYKIVKILKGENFREELRSPLTEAGMNIKEGDFITAIDGQSTKDMDNIFKSLVGKANREIVLNISGSSDGSGARDVIVVPTDSELQLYYYNWVQNNIRIVNEATNGEVGYIHIPDMGVAGLNEFAKYFYPQLDKKALIIDDRGNGGGNVSPMIMERLSREITRANMSRNQQIPSQTPTKMMLGPKVLLVNQYSASDGDLFPYAFKKHKLGKVIGVRTWGGIVGIRGSLPFIDGTSLNKPEFTSYDSEGNGYIVEGHGVDPDIIVENDPYDEYFGTDAQLNKAIEVIMEELKNYKGLPPIPAAPVR